jgi:hypothetical protein
MTEAAAICGLGYAGIMMKNVIRIFFLLTIAMITASVLRSMI